MGGLCKKHYEEDRAKSQRADAAVSALHSGLIDGQLVTAGPLRDEFERLRRWWDEVCSALRAEREHPVLLDETEFGMDWCIAIAQEIIDAERDFRAGKDGDTETRKYIRQETWLRFENLERGLMSNGVARPQSRR